MSTSAPPAEPGSNERLALRQLAEEQAALRRVATLVAQGAASEDVFAAVAHEVAQLIPAEGAALTRFEPDGMVTALGGWTAGRGYSYVGRTYALEGTVSGRVFETGRPERVEKYSDGPGPASEAAREMGWRSSVGAPIAVEGRLWGALAVASTTDRELPPDTERRLVGFSELVATAIANEESREKLTRLAEEQEALRRVATLVAAGTATDEVFAAVGEEVARTLDFPIAALLRYHEDRSVTMLAVVGAEFGPIHPRWPREDQVLASAVFDAAGPVRSDYLNASGRAAEIMRADGVRWGVGVPIVVDGDLWGVMGVFSKDSEPPPADTEARLAKFTELLATAIAKAESHEELRLLAEEQAALRRVATLVAEGAEPNDVFGAVADEVAAMFGVPIATMLRFDHDGSATLVGTVGPEYVAVGARFPIENSGMLKRVFETGLSMQIEDWTNVPGPGAEIARQRGIRWSVGVPIVVDGALWGMIIVASQDAVTFEADVEPRLAKFTELVATAIANSQAHQQLAELADEQAALRRVATLVAEGASPDRVFDTVRHEVARTFNAPLSVLMRYDADGSATVLATANDYLGPVGRRWKIGDDRSAVARVCRTGRPARVDYTGPVDGSIADAARREGARSAVGVPVVVDGAFWGVMAVGSRESEPMPAHIEQRLEKFTQLLATAIANAEGRAELDASRARIVATADATRRRIERDLHDGAQQQLVWLALALRAAQTTVPEDFEQHRGELGRVIDGLTAVLDELREIALGIHPAGLSEDGLAPALRRLVARSPLRVNLDVRADGRFPELVEVAAYYVVAETLTNAAKYADAPVVDVEVAADGESLRVEVRDAGRGGATPSAGSGLLGLRDRVEAIGGTMRLSSPPGAGTTLNVELPLRQPTVR
jgi:signal transduction histidine kinase/uncharacterized protein YoaH (UPF0181 family)